MATFNGNDGVVKIGANQIGEVMSFTVNQTAETIDDTVMGDSWRSHLPGLKSWDGSVEARWSDQAGDNQETILVGTSITLNVLTEGDGAGKHKITGTATVTGVSQTQSYDNTTVTRTFTFQGNGALTIGTV